MIWPYTRPEMIHREPILKYRIFTVKDRFLTEKYNEVSCAQVMVEFRLPAEQIFVWWLRDPADNIPPALVFLLNLVQRGVVYVLPVDGSLGKRLYSPDCPGSLREHNNGYHLVRHTIPHGPSSCWDRPARK